MPDYHDEEPRSGSYVWIRLGALGVVMLVVGLIVGAIMNSLVT